MSFTVEITTGPANDGWAVHRRVLDNVPGSILMEDQDEPVLIIPVDAESEDNATQFVRGLCLVMGLTVISGYVYLTPPNDSDIDFGGHDSESPLESSMVTRLREWVEHAPAIRRDEGCATEHRVFA